MPYMALEARAAGSREFSADPHHGGPCTCIGAAALLRHRVLPYPDQRRYGPTPARPVRFNRRVRLSFTDEGDGTVVTCLGCGWTRFADGETEARRMGRTHEACPKPPKRKRK